MLPRHVLCFRQNGGRPSLETAMKKSWIILLVKAVVSVALLAVLTWTIDRAALADMLRRIELGGALLALLPLLATFLLQAERFRRILLPIAPIRFGGSLSIVWIGQFFGQLLPSTVGADAFRAWYLNRLGVDWRSSLLVTLLDRLYGVTGLFLLLALGIPWLLARDGSPILAGIALLIVLSGGSALLVSVSLDRLMPDMPRWVWIGAGLRFSASLRQRMRDGRLGFAAILLSLLVQLLQALTLWIIAGMIGLQVPFMALAFVTPLSNIAMMMPISIAGWGIREAVMVAVLDVTGMPAPEALAMSLILGLLSVIAALPGLPIWLATRESAGTIPPEN